MQIPRLTDFVCIAAVDSGNMAALYMNASNVGLWQLICHINDHLSSGMLASYHVMTLPLVEQDTNAQRWAQTIWI